MLCVFDGTPGKAAFIDRERPGKQIVVVPNLSDLLETRGWTPQFSDLITDPQLQKFEFEIRKELGC